MKKYLLYILLLSLCVHTACKRQKVTGTRYLTFTANPSYTGSHPTTGLVSNIYIQDKTDHMLFFTDMTGGDVSKAYKLHIHAADTSEPFGYTGNPVIDLGTLTDGKPLSTEVTYSTFEDFFYGNFKGYYIVHDPDQVSNDTTTLLIYGKIGSWE